MELWRTHTVGELVLAEGTRVKAPTGIDDLACSCAAGLGDTGREGDE